MGFAAKVWAMAALLALLSSVLWGSADFDAGRLSKKHKPLVVLAVTQIFGLITGIILVLISREWTFSSSYLAPGALAGLCGYAGLICLYQGLSTGRMGVVSPISSLSVLLPLSIAFIGGEEVSTIGKYGIALAVVGGFLASGPELSSGVTARPVFLGLGAALGFGGALTFMAHGSETSALLTMTTMRATTLVISLGYLFKTQSLDGLNSSHLPRLVAIGVADFAANLLLGVATTKGLVSLAMVLGSLYPIVTALLAFRFLHERLHKVQYVGIVLAVAGVAVISAL